MAVDRIPFLYTLHIQCHKHKPIWRYRTAICTLWGLLSLCYILTIKWAYYFRLNAVLSLLSKIYSIFKWFGTVAHFSSCGFYKAKYKMYLFTVLLKSVISFSTVCSNGLHLHFPISVSLPSSCSFLWLCSSMSYRPKHSYTTEGLL